MSAAFATLLARWSGWIATASLQAGVVALAVLAADLVLRRFAWPKLRLALHALVVVKLFVPPGVVGGPADAWSMTGLADVGFDSMTRAAPASSLPAVLFATWCTGALVLIVGGVVRHRRARRQLRASGEPAPPRVVELAETVAASLGLRRAPDVVVSDLVAAPLVFGGREPFVALPRAAVAERFDDDLVHVLMHELAHVRRRDAFAAALVWLAASLFWFHPLVALIARRMAGLRELCCDATVAAHLRGDARRIAGYRATLLRAAASSSAHATPAGALGFGSSSPLIARLEWLARRRRIRPRVEFAGTALAVSLAAGLVLPTARTIDRAVETARGDPADDLFARARSTVDAALAGRRPPGCLALQYSVMALAAQSERTAPRAP